MESIHKAVLLHEVVSGLVTRSDLVGCVNYLDCTIGGCGHALAIAEALKGNLNIIGLDRDPRSIERAKVLLSGKAEKVILENEDFRNLDKVLDKNEIKNVDLILMDLGLSSDQLQDSMRGFSFQADEPLLMTMNDPTKHLFNAGSIVNNWKEEDIANVIFAYGEERFARRIAKGIVEYREKKEIETSGELVEIIKMRVPAFYRRGKIHPATKTFQALRIAVNDELNSLKEGLEKSYERLNIGGRMAVISFHSLEDRIVKNFYKEKANTKESIVTKKPVCASLEEVRDNPRSRSAKLRIFQK
ncbi:MAG: 16S rRNA (cytosine(1402)-N(4))-methyltransferase RsmH [Candidatus Paceibacterota bacterium]|jgi:16S rRNA (cytosine1402-N4)-methyltransferase